ncbi:hypothetical protein Ahy_A05g025418 [Arachis hypogaea]|uniref:MULE transposase domain-containing protein n=1 Tax=Arachis hypogaea TaxID=3818 RepID=A0A445D8N2_ARAHY|nr:hypothetical protein Ahy_A05g025418 [Arachis hypogaea]
MEFETLNQFRKAVQKFNINIGRSVFFARCDSTRSKAICYDEDCPWQIYCAKRTFQASYQVKTFVNEHTCSRDNHFKSADGKWVIDELEERIRLQPNLSVKEADQFFKAEYDVLINERKIYRSMKKANERIEGSEIAQYALLRDYANKILKTNPGSTVRIHTNPMPDSNPIFLRIYVCFEACKRGFVGGCRPFIGLDGTFLRGYYGGQLLTAIGQDANNHIYLIAYAIVESENKDSWKCFLDILQDNVGDFLANGFSFMSDMQKSKKYIRTPTSSCRHACAALAYQNKRLEEYAHNWLTMGAYNAAYQTSMRPVPSQEFWEHLDTLPILPPRYKKPIGRPSTKRDKRNDAPKDKTDPHRTKRRIATIVCKYCLQAGHNKRSCKKRKEAMGEGSAAPQVLASDADEDMLAEMYHEETLKAVEAEVVATEVGNDSTAAQTSQGASVGTTTRFVQFMLTTDVDGISGPKGTGVRGRGDGRGRGRRGSSIGAKNGISSGSSNSKPML